MRILVTGATGNVGRPTARALVARGHDVRAVVRGGERDGLPDGVERVALDFHDPRSWDAALRGCDGLFLLRPPPIADVAATLNPLATRARDLGVTRVVFLSVTGAGSVRFIPHRKVEDHLRALDGVRWTFLRAGFFMQNLATAYRDDIARDGRIYVPAGEGLVAWVDAGDLGEAAAVAFDADAGVGAAWHLTGPESLRFSDVAAVMSDELRRDVRYEPASLYGYARHLRARGLPWAQVAVQSVLHTAIRTGREGVVDPTLARVLGRAPTTLRAFVAASRALWAAP